MCSYNIPGRCVWTGGRGLTVYMETAMLMLHGITNSQHNQQCYNCLLYTYSDTIYLRIVVLEQGLEQNVITCI